MTAIELYEVLNKAGVHYEVVEILEGSRHIQVFVQEETEEELNDLYSHSPDR